ncbi:hypothetical protein PVAP13_1KG359377 [Panicum virgatum]|uniref:Uncharacterized protein n=1 Tax=Panicum virgatum TaxID=38727 RepID=A0A8T0X6N1_PANVG|nr:hypothetical protein PVAP13_1KG359377 [Panicum virgatum]
MVARRPPPRVGAKPQGPGPCGPVGHPADAPGALHLRVLRSDCLGRLPPDDRRGGGSGRGRRAGGGTRGGGRGRSRSRRGWRAAWRRRPTGPPRSRRWHGTLPWRRGGCVEGRLARSPWRGPSSPGSLAQYTAVVEKLLALKPKRLDFARLPACHLPS